MSKNDELKNLNNPVFSILNKKPTELTQPVEVTKTTQPKKVVKEVKQETEKEIKEARIQLVVKPSVLADIKVVQSLKHCSLNSLLNDLILKCIDENKEKIEKYKELIGE